MVTAKIFALEVYGFLKDGAQKAVDVLAAFQPVQTRESYVEALMSLRKTETVLPDLPNRVNRSDLRE